MNPRPPVSASSPRPALFRPALIVGLATVLSRLLGFARDVAVAGLLGAGPIADAFLAAVRLPNALRRTLGEGALNAGFVPIYVRLKRNEGGDAAAAFAIQANLIFALVLAVATGLAMAAAGVTVMLVAPGFGGDPVRFAQAESLLRTMLPFVGLASLASLVGAWLNAEQRFLSAAVAPAGVNAVLLAVYLLLPHVMTGEGPIATAMALALVAAGALQLVIVLAAAARLPRARRAAPVRWRLLGRLLVVGAPALVAGASTQLLVLVAAAAASRQPGAVSWLYYADRLFQLPLSFAGVAAGTVLLSDMASAGRSGDGSATAGAKSDRDALNGPLEASLALALPAAMALVALAEPIVRTLFQRGAFEAQDVAGTAGALAALALGLPAGVATKVLLQPFFVRELAAVPLLSGLVGIAATWLVARAGDRFGLASPGSAVAVGLGVQALLLAGLLIVRGWWRPDWLLLRRVAALIAASVVMVVAVTVLAEMQATALAGPGIAVRLSALAGLCLAGVALYGIAAIALGGIDRRALLRLRA